MLKSLFIQASCPSLNNKTVQGTVKDRTTQCEETEQAFRFGRDDGIPRAGIENNYGQYAGGSNGRKWTHTSTVSTVSREMEILRTYQKGRPEIRNTITEMKDAFDRFARR